MRGIAEPVLDDSAPTSRASIKTLFFVTWRPPAVVGREALSCNASGILVPFNIVNSFRSTEKL